MRLPSGDQTGWNSPWSSSVSRRGSPETGDGVVRVEVGGAGTTSVVTEAAFDKPLPVALHAEYALNGQVVAPTEVLGAEGDLTITYTVTNTTAERTTVQFTDGSGQTRTREVPVFVPFAGSLDVLLPPGTDLVEAVDSVRSTDGQGRTLLSFPLLLAPPLGDYQAVSVVRLRTADAATPRAMLDVAPQPSATRPASAFSSSALTGAVEGNTELADGLGELGDQADLLSDGAASLAAGADDLASGTAVLADQVGGALLAGSQAIEGGSVALADGAQTLAVGLAAVGSGTDEVTRGLADLTSGLDDLAGGLRALAGKDGLPLAAETAGALSEAAGAIADGVGTANDGPWPPPDVLPGLPDFPDLPDLPELPDLGELDAETLAALTPEQLVALVTSRIPGPDVLDELQAQVPPPTLVQSIRLLEQGAGLLVDVSTALVASATEQTTALTEAAAASKAAAAGATGLAAEVCGPAPSLTPDQCAALGAVADDAQEALEATATAAAAAVTQKVLAAGLAAGLTGLESALGLVEASVLDLSAALRSGSPTDPGLVEALDLLEDGLADAVSGASQLLSGVDAAVRGSAALTDGAGALGRALGEASDGADALAQGADELAAGTSAQVDGVTALATGTQELAAGARAASSGSSQVADGVQALVTEGIDPAAQAVRDAVAEPALAAAWLSATDERAANALPYGPPDGAVGHVAYRLTMPATQPDHAPAWPWWVLGAAVLAGAAVIASRRLASR